MANALSDFLSGYDAGNTIIDQQRQQRQQNRLVQLAPQVVAGDPGAYAQAAAINPQAAQQYQAGGDAIALRARGAAKYLQAALQSGDQRQIMAARQSIKPFMDTLQPGHAYPLDMDPAQEAAGLQGFLAQTEHLDPMFKQGTPTAFREFQMKAAAAGLQPGSAEYQNAAKIALGQEGRASSAGFSQVKFTGPDGRERVGVMNGRTGRIDLPDGTSFDPQTGSIAPTQGAAMAPTLPQGGGQQVIEQDAQLANQMIAAGIPSDQVDRFLQGRAAQFSGAARAAVPATNPNAFVGRAPEEQAAATESAKQAAQLQYLPQELGMRTNAAIQQAGGIAANVPAGYRRTADGGLQAIPGGPADKPTFAAKPMPAGAIKQVFDLQDQLQGSENVMAMTQKHLARLDAGQLDVRPGAAVEGLMRNKAGLSDANSRNLAEWDADRTEMVNESLRLNKGVQTEGDAARAIKGLMEANDAKSLKQSMARLQTINQRAITLRQKQITALYQNYGRGPDGEAVEVAPRATAPAASATGAGAAAGGVDDLLSKYGVR